MSDSILDITRKVESLRRDERLDIAKLASSLYYTQSQPREFDNILTSIICIALDAQYTENEK